MRDEKAMIFKGPDLYGTQGFLGRIENGRVSLLAVNFGKFGRRPMRGFVFSLLFVAIVIAGCSNPDETANQYFVEASQLFKSGQEMEKTSFLEASKAYKEVSDKLDLIISKCPSSQIAVKLIQGETKIGTFKYDNFKESILKQCERKAKAEESFFSLALITAEQVEKKREKAEAIIAIIDGYQVLGDKTKATEILDLAFDEANLIENPYWKAKRLAEVASRALSLGDRKRAFLILNQALEATPSIEEPYNKFSIVLEISGIFIGGDERKKGFEVLAQAIELIDVLDEAFQVKALPDIAGRYIEAGEKEKGLEYLATAIQKIDASKYKARELANIASWYAGIDIERGLRVAKTIPSNDLYKSASYVSIAKKCFSSGDKAKAIDILAQALEIASAIEEPSEKAWALNRVAREYTNVGEREKAVEIVSQSVEVAKSIPNEEMRALALIEVASLTMDSGNNNLANDLLTQAFDNTISASKGGPYFKATTLLDIGIHFASLGEKKSAFEALTHALERALKLDDPGEKVGLYCKIGKNWGILSGMSGENGKEVLHNIVSETIDSRAHDLPGKDSADLDPNAVKGNKNINDGKTNSKELNRKQAMELLTKHFSGWITRKFPITRTKSVAIDEIVLSYLTALMKLGLIEFEWGKEKNWPDHFTCSGIRFTSEGKKYVIGDLKRNDTIRVGWESECYEVRVARYELVEILGIRNFNFGGDRAEIQCKVKYVDITPFGIGQVSIFFGERGDFNPNEIFPWTLHASRYDDGWRIER